VEAFLGGNELGARGNGMSQNEEDLEGYLDELSRRLHGSGDEVRRVLIESEAHLRDSIDAGVAAGLEERAAARSALDRFGTAAQVAEAANKAFWDATRWSVYGAVAGMLVFLAAAGMIVVGVSAGVASLVASLTSTHAVFGLPAAVQMPAESCAHWLAVQPGTITCQQAGTLEAADDLTRSMALVGILGVILLAAYGIVRRRGRGRARVLPPVLAPAVGTSVFGSAAVGFAALAAGNAVLFMTWGAGLWWTLAGCSALAAGVSAWLLTRALSHGSLRRPPIGRAAST
jgi:hypothetical protein